MKGYLKACLRNWCYVKNKMAITSDYYLTMGSGCFLVFQLRINHIIVKLGMKSVPGSNSSTIPNNPPIAPFHPPKVMKKIRPDIGAQTISANSPKTGKAYVAYPKRSIAMQKIKEGCLFIMT